MRISIFGYGVTTTPLVEYLNAQGHSLRIFDDKFQAASQDERGNALLPSQDFDPAQSDMEILSPGIPPTHSLVRAARHLISEYDYFENLLESRDEKPYIVWISGTNGKTTTTEMTTRLLEPFGACAGGNIGTPLAKLYTQASAKVWVLETSSFSLHYTKRATPRIYALLPVREDHITWHGSFEAYVEDKLSPLARMGQEDCALIPSELATHKLVRAFQGRLIAYDSSYDLSKKLALPLESVRFKEPFLLDALLALSVAKLGFDTLDIARLNSFKLGAHRIAEFYDAQGRLWVDDSKGTNVDATIEAIRRYEDKRVLVILGGDDKGANLTPLFEFMRGKRIEIVSIGRNEPRLIALAKEYGLRLVPKGDLENAMRYIHARRGVAGNEPVIVESRAQKSGGSKDFHSSATYANKKTCGGDSHLKGGNAWVNDESCEGVDSQHKGNAPDSLGASKDSHQGNSAGVNQCGGGDLCEEIDVVLLSPAAASLDQFSSYKARGELFTKLALNG